MGPRDNFLIFQLVEQYSSLVGESFHPELDAKHIVGHEVQIVM